MTSQNVVVTIWLRARNRPNERRKYLVPKDKASFNDLIDGMEKLFGCRLCHNKCVYLDTNGESIAFSSDQELSLAFHLLKGNSLKVQVTESPQTDHQNQSHILKEDNPSELSTDCSLNSSLSCQPGSTSACSSSTEIKSVDATTPKSTLFRSLILPKLSKQFNTESPQRLRKSTTRVRQSGHVATQDDTNTNRPTQADHDLLTMDLANEEDASFQEGHDSSSSKRSPLLSSGTILSPGPGSNTISLHDLFRALVRIIVWLGDRLT